MIDKPLINVKNLSAKLVTGPLESVYVANDINLSIMNNEYVGLVGESGSGKSQLAKTICALNENYLKVTSGLIEYNFKDDLLRSYGLKSEFINSYSQIKEDFRNNNFYGSRIGMMYQNPSTSFNPYWSIREHFDQIHLVSSIKKSEFITLRNKLLKKLKVSETLDRSVFELSGGQKQRLIIAMVLMGKPELIIGDEIGTGIDIKLKYELYKYLDEIRQTEIIPGWKPSLLLISHDMGFVFKLVDRIYVMYGGEIKDEINLINSSEGGRRYTIKEIINERSSNLHPYTKALFNSVVSRTYSIDLEPPNLGILASDRKTNWSNLNLKFEEENIEDFEWLPGWEHLKIDSQNKKIIDIKFNGHCLSNNRSNEDGFKLHPVEFSLQKNEILGIIGESGSGKTTLGKIITGYPGYNPSISGSEIIYYDENNESHDYLLPQNRNNLNYPIQMIFQDPKFALNPNITIHETLVESMKIGFAKEGLPFEKEIINQQILNLLKPLGLSNYLNTKASSLSGGQLRRLGIARILSSKPRVIVADEPVASLDAVVKNGIFKLLTWDVTKNLGFLRNSEDSWYPGGRGIILVSHDIKSIDRFCSRIMVFKDGKLVEEGGNPIGPGFAAKETYTKQLFENYEFFSK